MESRSIRAKSRPAPASGDTLERRLEQAPLPLGEALVCARDVATHLRDLHEEGRAHGEVIARMVLLRHTGCVLMPPSNGAAYASSLTDVVAFGTLFYEMLTSRKPTAEALLSTPLQGPPSKGPGAVQSDAVRLAERCLTALPDSGPTMQRVLTELRLLTVQTRQWETDEATATAPSGYPASRAKRPRMPVEYPPELDEGEGEMGLDLLHGPDGSNSNLPVDAKIGGGEEDLLADGHCPRCRCSKVRVSRPRNRVERFLRAIGLPVRRCHRCYYRYIDLFKACLEMPTKKFNR